MMAGVVAMASVIEDFDIQPCKKSRNDGGNPVVKTITNYFSPVSKPMEKPFSPPRPNNIMDYFIRKGPTKTSSPEQLKDACQKTELNVKCGSLETAVKQPSQKRSKKTSKAARKLVEDETVKSTEEESCVIVVEQHDRESTVERDKSVHSDKTHPLVQPYPVACSTGGKLEFSATKTLSEIDVHCEDGLRHEKSIKLHPELSCIELSPISPSNDKAKQFKTAQNPKKKQQLGAKHSDPVEKQTECSLSDVTMEVNVDKASRVNSSTVTISFEEFLRSQSQAQDVEDIEEDSKTTGDTEETDQFDTRKVTENVGSQEPPLQVSPQTLTIQAEVHVISPKQEAVTTRKLASIFNRRKGVESPTEVLSSAHMQAGHQLSSSSVTVKRKSNVVLDEEDLELAVLESESTPKCTEVERQQFMAAFKQATLDGSKTKSGKSQSKQKQPEEMLLGSADKFPEEETIIPQSVEKIPADSQDEKVAKKKPDRKGRKKEESMAVSNPPAAPVEEMITTTVVVDDKTEESPLTSPPSIPGLRRSRRETVVRKTSEASPAPPVRKNRQPTNESKDAPSHSPLKKRKSKHGVFKTEMVCPPDINQSPIRIKFIRVHKNVPSTKGESEGGRNTSISNEAKKRKRAKKLVEKARVIQQSKNTAVKEKATLRRSSRTTASAKKSYSEDEDSVICLEEVETATPQMTDKSKPQKSLRSLNDVLGKVTNPPSGSKVAPLVQEKTARKVSAVNSIFDENSCEGSENSQDDEQFRARREFLKSGLPESLRKQIAKTTATKEAYSLSRSSFQPVIHMTQPPKDCPLSSLPWPRSSLLCHLQEFCYQTSNPLLGVSGSLCAKTEPTHRVSYEKFSAIRPEISESVRQLLTEEVRTSNPQFPVETFINRFLKRRADHQQQCTASEPETVPRLTSITVPAESVGGKRKRMSEWDMTMKVAKKQRANSSEENSSAAEPQPIKREARTRRARRSKAEEETNDKAKPSVNAVPIPREEDSVIVILDEDTGKKDVKEDMLWTDKYHPQHSSDIVGNVASVRRLHSWLREWKLRADRDERNKQTDKKKDEDSDWDCGEGDSQDGEDILCNTVLITGPTGVGKTAAVYACAQELGFKVFEVNASSPRNGRLILSQLKEATQSHQVDSQGVNAHKPTYFNSYSTSSSTTSSARPGSSPRKVNSPRRVVSSPRKHPHSPRGAKRGGLTPTSLANFFKMGRPTSKDAPTTEKNEQTASCKNSVKARECGSRDKDPAVNLPAANTPKERNSEEQSKKTATSLILFEEVDVIFDDDSGFLAAIKTFMTTTKRPVILTTSDPAFSTMFDGNFEEIHFKAPSVLDASSFLRLLCLIEDIRTDQWDISSLLRFNGCDMRKSLLQLQFWSCSGGGRFTNRPLTNTVKNANLKPENEDESCAVIVPSAVPPCDAGCTESMLGLLNVAPDQDIWQLLQSCIPEEASWWDLLTNARRRRVDLLYSNMEALLPLPLSQLTTSTYKPEHTVSLSQDHPSFSQNEHACLPDTAESVDCSDDASPIKVSRRMKKSKSRHCLPDQDVLDSDSEDSFLSLCNPQIISQPKKGVTDNSPCNTLKRNLLTPEERLKCLPVSQCLESVAEFLDNMSYMDSSLSAPQEGGKGETVPVVALVKDGMTDESRLEIDRRSWMTGEHALEILDAVEALSFRRCRTSVAEAWDKAQQLEGELGKQATAELTLPVAAHCDMYSFTQDNPCHPHLVQQRREVMEGLIFKGLAGTLCNRPAAALEYLPALRTICRSEQLREQGKVKRRFLHYLDAIHLGLERSTLKHLAEDFP